MFRTDEHRKRFFEVIHRIGKDYGGELDKEYSAALYILTSRSGTWEKAELYVSSSGILFEDMLNEVDFSHGYVSIIYLAWSLFTSGYHFGYNDDKQTSLEKLISAISVGDITIPGLLVGKVDMGELCSLDESNFKIAIEAILIRRYGIPQEDINKAAEAQ